MPVLDNPKWEAYAQARAEGLSQRKAYKKAYPEFNGTDGTADNKGCELWKIHEIRVRYEELKARAADGAVLTRREKREMLADMARNRRLSTADRQRAIDMDNRMEGEYVTKVQGELNVTKLEDLL